MLGKPCWSGYEMYPISGYFSKLGAHLTMLSDRRRVEFYENSLRKVIIPGKSVVLDIGTGTGILAMLAARCGAKKVYAIECGDIINVAKKIVAENGLDDKIEFVRGLSNEVELPEKVDIVVTETMGFTGLEENIEEILRDAKIRFGHKDTVLIPSKLNVFVALSDDKTARTDLIDAWNKDFFGFNYGYLSGLSKDNIFTRQIITKESIKSDTGIVSKIDFYSQKENNRAKLTVNDDCMLEGIVGWFNVESDGGVTLYGAEPPHDGHWQQFFVAFKQPIQANKDDSFSVSLSSEQPFIWDVVHCRGEQILDSFKIDNGTILKALKNEQ